MSMSMDVNGFKETVGYGYSFFGYIHRFVYFILLERRIF